MMLDMKQLESVDSYNMDGDTCATTQDGILTNHLMEEAIDKQLANLEEEEEEVKDKNPAENLGAAKDETLSASEAMDILTQMSQNVKTILDDDIGGAKVPASKRMHADEENLVNSSKRVKHGSAQSKAVKKQLQRLTRDEIEEIVATVIVDLISSKSEVGQLRRRCDAYEELNEKWKKKTAALQKMCQDLNIVMRRFVMDVQKGKDKVAPVKITRSVGLQVVLADRRKLTAPSSMAPMVIAKRPGMTNQVQQHVVRIIQKPPPVIQPKPIVPAPPLNALAVMQATPLTPLANGHLVQKQPPVVSAIARHPIILPPGVNITSIGASPPIVAQQQPLSVPVQKPVIDLVDIADDDDTPVQTPIPNRITYAVVSSIQQNVPNRLVFTQTTNNTSPILIPSLPSNIMVSTPRPPQLIGRPILVQPPRAFIHPAPVPDVLPSAQRQIPGKKIPPKPKLKITKVKTGIVLSWTMDELSEQNNVASYQIYAYQETGNQAPSQALWKKVGDVKALPLPMACTLTQFANGNKYHFAIRAHDHDGRVSLFSDPQSFALT